MTTTIQKQAAEKAIALLNASGAQYKVIFSDGTEYGELEAVQKKRTRNVTIPYGTLQPLYKPYIDEMQVGSVIQLSIAEAEALGGTATSLRSAASAYASKLWGNGTYISTITDKHVEILRIS